MDASAKIYLGIALMIVMAGMGLSLTFQDFRRVLLYPKAVLAGLFNQLILLPLIALLLVNVTQLRPDLAVGLMVLAVCPGGPTSNLITHLCKGDTALSVTLTALSSILTLFSIPYLLNLILEHYAGAGAEVYIEPAGVFKELLLVVLLPVTLGMVINHYRPAFATKMEKPVKIASALILFLLIVVLTVKESDKLIPYFSQVGLSTLALNVLSLTAGYFTAGWMGLSVPQRLTISIETGIQNGTLAIAICLGILRNADYAIPAAVYSLLMFLTAFVLIAYTRRKRASLQENIPGRS